MEEQFADCLDFISIHSAARAETLTFSRPLLSVGISIHSAARAETCMTVVLLNASFISIHSAARAETSFQYQR